MRGLAVMIDRMSHTPRADSRSTISSNAPAARPRRRSRAVICSTASATSAADSTRGSIIPQMPGHTDASRSAWSRAAFTRTNTSAPPWPARAMASLTSPRACALRVSTTPSSRSSVMASASLCQAWLTRSASVIGANRLERRTRMAIRQARPSPPGYGEPLPPFPGRGPRRARPTPGCHGHGRLRSGRSLGRRS